MVPSLTEALIVLGAGERLVGRTRYCTHPPAKVARIEAVGGTKNPDVARVIAIRPDLVVLNREENRREDWRALVEAGLEVFVTHPRTVGAAADMLEELGARAGVGEAAARLAAACRAALAEADRRRARLRRPLRVLCPIWRNPWMTFGPRTYIGDMLACAGMENVVPADTSSDFFTFDLDSTVLNGADAIVLPDEPYVFGAKHAAELRRRGATAPIFCVDGKDLSWYGPRIPQALERLWKITDMISRT